MAPRTDIVFHGVRGSAPAQGLSFHEFGGDTPAIEIATADARLFIDAGSGLKNVRVSAALPDEIDLILSHYHYDHLIGLPFFDPAWRPACRLRIWAPQFDDRPPKNILSTLFSPPFCPISLEMFPARVEIRSYVPGESWTPVSDVCISTLLAEHPGGSAAIRVSTTSGDIAYASDVEVWDERAAMSLADFAADASLLIIDAMNDDATANARRGWGHSSWREAIAVGAAAQVGRTALFHHDPRSSDEMLNVVEAAAQCVSRTSFLARQGAVIQFNARAGHDAPPFGSIGEQSPWRCSK